NGPENWNSATRQADKCRMELSLVPGRVVVTRDGAALFDIVPTVADLLRGVVFDAPCQLAQYGVSSLCDEFLPGYGAENSLTCPDSRPNSTYKPTSTTCSGPDLRHPF